jgi:ABC-type lipoprotein export system ATPase subunit
MGLAVSSVGPTCREGASMLVAENVGHSKGRRELFSGLSLTVAGGTSVAITGPSGIGKTTLLHVLAGIEAPDRGAVRVHDVAISELSAGQRADFRLRRCGLVFQFAELIQGLTAVENVAVPARFSGTARGEAEDKARRLLERLGVSHLSGSTPDRMSGGEQQRVAIARALVNDPKVVFADEPTGMLDGENSAMVTDILGQLALENGCAVVIVTHDHDVARRTDVVFELSGHGVEAVG